MTDEELPNFAIDSARTVVKEEFDHWYKYILGTSTTYSDRNMAAAILTKLSLEMQERTMKRSKDNV